MIRNLEQLKQLIKQTCINPSLEGDIICKSYGLKPFKPMPKKEAIEWIRCEEMAIALKYMRTESINLVRKEVCRFEVSNTPSNSKLNKLIFKNKKVVATPYITDFDCAVLYAYEYITEKYISLDIIQKYEYI